MTGGKLDLPRMFGERESERGALHTRHLNEQLVRVLKTIGFDVGFKRGQGQYLFDRKDQRYLDLLSGFGSTVWQEGTAAVSFTAASGACQRQGAMPRARAIARYAVWCTLTLLWQIVDFAVRHRIPESIFR